VASGSGRLTLRRIDSQADRRERCESATIHRHGHRSRSLPDNVETLQKLDRSLAVERTSLSEAQAEIERLHLIIKKLQRSQFGRRAERLDDDQLRLSFAVAAALTG
jgi:hypothetical protein